MNLEVETDAEGREFCESIAREMVRLFGISLDEAVGRINRAWRDDRAVVADSVVYHETDSYWAKKIYYGKESSWWLDQPGLKPLPFP
ncbi:hypothetical protein [Tahibacter sp.]|uniref:hypothetical protein n=1 Tax=Tahibacter sp. TaxID=2056211 RepID=UPI0028C4CF08|nr:hypothetical protein [Tahibacter sp.]